MSIVRRLADFSVEYRCKYCQAEFVTQREDATGCPDCYGPLRRIEKDSEPKIPEMPLFP